MFERAANMTRVVHSDFWRCPAWKELKYVPPDDEPDRDLVCCVCLEWPVDPVILGCPGGHMLCRDCVQGPLCPLDRQPYARLHPPQRPITMILDRLRVYCTGTSAGCSWTGPRGNFHDHAMTCPFVELVCVQCGCHMRPSDEAFASHVHAEDFERPVDLGVAETTPSPNSRARLQAISRVIDAYELAERMNVCFVVDSTGSMRSHIHGVKNQIEGIVHELRARLPSMQLHLAFIGYRDHCDTGRIVTLPFQSSVVCFRGFVADVEARGGGGDGPEDVHGALHTACDLDWSVGGAATRVLIHIADYPAHGRRYNDCPRDSHPDGDPHGLDLETLFRTLKDLSVQYVFGHITPHTSKMVRVINEALDNYIISAEMQDVELLAEVVTSSIHQSVATTVSTLTSLHEAQTPIVLSGDLPDWNTVVSDSLLTREVCPVSDVSLLLAGADPAATRQLRESNRVEVQLAATPFSQGETRVARHALRNGFPAVAKHFKHDNGDDEGVIHALLSLSEVSAVASFLAECFSALRPVGERVSFLPVAVVEGDNVVPFNLETALPAADFRRFSNNVGWWESGAPRTLMQFTRFTHETTHGHMMVVDLQGVHVDDGWVLTDPCVLCEDVERFGSGNMGPHAMTRCLAALEVRLDDVPVTFSVGGASPSVKPAKQADVSLKVDTLIDVLAPGTGNQVKLDEGQLKALLREARDTLLRQPTLLELEAPIRILGDLHGQYRDLLRHFELGGYPPDSNYLALGDYVDRGKQSIETVSLLLAYKVKYPENMFLLRGNHECASITRIYGFYDECKRRYNIKLWKQFCDMFNCLPPVAVIQERILCMHGGPSPELVDFDSIRNLPRPSDVPDVGLLCDLLWSDPDPDASGWVENDGRGVSFAFGPAVLDEMLPRLGIDLIARAHQVVEDGYEMFADRRLVTLFSAPNYIGEFDNAGAMMKVDDNLKCSFTVLPPKSK